MELGLPFREGVDPGVPPASLTTQAWSGGLAGGGPSCSRTEILPEEPVTSVMALAIQVSVSSSDTRELKHLILHWKGKAYCDYCDYLTSNCFIANGQSEARQQESEGHPRGTDQSGGNWPQVIET